MTRYRYGFTTIYGVRYVVAHTVAGARDTLAQLGYIVGEPFTATEIGE